MSDPAYGQQPQMEHDSMVGTLATQIQMIWPLEWPLMQRLGLDAARQVVDLGCGTGEFAGRLADACPDTTIHGLDLFEGHITIAREKWDSPARAGLTFDVGDALQTGLDDDAYDLATLRHFLHALPEPERVLQEVRRILKPGGIIYTLSEDYAGLIFDVEGPARSLFNDAHPGVLAKGTNLHHGREAFRLLRAAGFEDVRVDPLVVDTTNSDRATLARMLEFWRDGYAGFVAEALGVPEAEGRARFQALIDSVRDPERYACWLNFAVSGLEPIQARRGSS